MAITSATGDWQTQTRNEFPHISGFEIASELGRGGMGVVYRARHLASHQIVALKIIRDSAFAGQAVRARFRREAEAIAQLAHPNIVQFQEIGETEFGPYLAMEFIEGGNLEQFCRLGPQSFNASARFIRTLAEAVAHAHDQQIIHRDLKPANVLLERILPGDELTDFRPVIADFGLAKRLDSESTAVTHHGAILGTPGYLAPEQAAGQTEFIGPATDIHALGLLLYELLSGRPPFTNYTFERLIHQIIHDDPLSLSAIRPDVPVALESIVVKCLEKHPHQRFASARELADELDRFLNSRPIQIVMLNDDDRIRRAARRDGFTIVDIVGRGPRSIVFQVRHESSTKALALKVFERNHTTQPEWDIVLQRCRELTPILSHPHIVTVIRGGCWDGFPFLVTEFAPLGSLATMISGVKLPIKRVLTIVQRIAECLQYFHRQGIVHGNLKLSNILLAPGDIPQLVDARPAGAFSRSLPRETEPLRLIKTIPPEFITDPIMNWHPTADIYGIGVILFELLTGRFPFDDSSIFEAPLVSSIRPDLPPLLDSLTRSCLARNPWRRWKRAYDLVQRLRSIASKIEEPSRRSHDH